LQAEPASRHDGAAGGTTGAANSTTGSGGSGLGGTMGAAGGTTDQPAARPDQAEALWAGRRLGRQHHRAGWLGRKRDFGRTPGSGGTAGRSTTAGSGGTSSAGGATAKGGSSATAGSGGRAGPARREALAAPVAAVLLPGQARWDIQRPSGHGHRLQGYRRQCSQHPRRRHHPGVRHLLYARLVFPSGKTPDDFNGVSMYSSKDLATWKNEGCFSQATQWRVGAQPQLR